MAEPRTAEGEVNRHGAKLSRNREMLAGVMRDEDPALRGQSAWNGRGCLMLAQSRVAEEARKSDCSQLTADTTANSMGNIFGSCVQKSETENAAPEVEGDAVKQEEETPAVAETTEVKAEEEGVVSQDGVEVKLGEDETQAVTDESAANEEAQAEATGADGGDNDGGSADAGSSD
jgi:hypothetical protein